MTENVMKATIKIDFKQLALDVSGAFLRYFMFPLLIYVWSFDYNFNFPIDGNTYWAIFAVLLFLNICRILAHPPRYRVVETYGDSPDEQNKN